MLQSARCAAEDSGRGARTSRGKTPSPASASQPASIRLIPPPASSTMTARADSQTSGRQSGSTRPVACGGVLRSSRVARVRNVPQPESSPARPARNLLVPRTFASGATYATDGKPHAQAESGAAPVLGSWSFVPCPSLVLGGPSSLARPLRNRSKDEPRRLKTKD